MAKGVFGNQIGWFYSLLSLDIRTAQVSKYSKFYHILTYETSLETREMAFPTTKNKTIMQGLPQNTPSGSHFRRSIIFSFVALRTQRKMHATPLERFEKSRV